MGEITVVFPGQGSQRAGMARDFHDEFPLAREVFTEASDALGFDVAKLCFDDDPRLDLTEFTQPAIVTAELAMLRVIQSEWGLAPTAFGGHSLGEYSALCGAGVLPLAQAVRLVHRRGALMQAAVPVGAGAMSAIVAARVVEAGIDELIADLGVDVANLNSLDQLVISGPTSGVEAAEARIAGKLSPGAHEVIRLNVSAPFHSRLMRGIEAEFRAELEAAAPHMKVSFATRVSSNLRGGFHAGTLDDLLAALTGQISGTVDWLANMRVLSANADRIVEIGPNRPLKRFFGTLGVEITSIINVKTARKGLAS